MRNSSRAMAVLVVSLMFSSFIIQDATAGGCTNDTYNLGCSSGCGLVQGGDNNVVLTVDVPAGCSWTLRGFPSGEIAFRFTGGGLNLELSGTGPSSVEMVYVANDGAARNLTVDLVNTSGGSAVASSLTFIQPGGTTATPTAAPPPTNDLCANATVISPTSLPASINGDTTSANNEAFDNSASVGFGGGGGADVFYRFTPAVSGSYTISLITNFDSAFGVYTGNCGSLTEVAAVDATVGGESSEIPLTAGTTYTLMVEGFSGPQRGPFTFSIASSTATATSTPTVTPTPTPSPTPCASGCDLTTVLGNLTAANWRTATLTSVFDAPVLNFTSSGLLLGAPTPFGRGSFGSFETTTTILMPETGTYRFTFNLTPSTPIGAGKRHPECRIRVFSPDALYQRSVSTAESGPNLLRTSLPVYVDVTAGSELKIALDLLSFDPSIEGSFTVTSITAEKVL